MLVSRAVSWLLRVSDAVTSQDTGATGGSGLIVVTRPAGRGLVGSFGWCLACTARGSGAAGQGSGVLHRGGALVQHTQPLISTPPPSCSRPAETRAPEPQAGPEPALSQCHQVLVQEPEGARQGQMGPDLGGVPESRRKDRGLDHARGPASTQRTLSLVDTPGGDPRRSAIFSLLATPVRC